MRLNPNRICRKQKFRFFIGERLIHKASRRALRTPRLPVIQCIYYKIKKYILPDKVLTFSGNSDKIENAKQAIELPK